MLPLKKHQYHSDHRCYRWKTTEQDRHHDQSEFHGLIGTDRNVPSTLRIIGSDCLWWGWTKLLLTATADVSGQWFVAWRHSKLYTTFSMSSTWINLMFAGRMDVVLEYRTVLAIINDPLSKRTMKVVNSRFYVICESARQTMMFKLRYMYNRFSQVGVNNDSLSWNPWLEQWWRQFFHR